MPFIQVWNVPSPPPERFAYWTAIAQAKVAAAAVSVPELKLANKDVTVRFFHDPPSFSAGLGATAHVDPITVIVELLFDKPERTLEVRRRFASALLSAVKKFDPEKDAFVSDDVEQMTSPSVA